MMIIMDLQGDFLSGDFLFGNKTIDNSLCVVYSTSNYIGDENARYRKTRKRSSRFIFG